MHSLFAEEPIKSYPTVGMICMIVYRIRSALKNAKEPRETDEFRWEYKAALMACGLHFPENEYVRRNEITREYIFSNLTDVIPLIRDISELKISEGTNNEQTVGEMVDAQLSTLRLVVPE